MKDLRDLKGLYRSSLLAGVVGLVFREVRAPRVRPRHRPRRVLQRET